MPQFVLVHYHEIALKRGNRAFFENRLRQNLELALAGIPHRGVRRISGRLIIELTPGTDIDQIRSRLARVPGIAHWAIAQQVAPEIETIEARLGEMVDLQQFSTFRIEARRADKLFALNSQQINQRVGAFIQQRSGKKVDLTNPELTCHIDLAEKYVFLYFHKEKGVGGLPVGTGGRLLSLLSGGIDSPVASYRLIRRGCRVHFVHFHSFPFTTLDSQEKVRQLAQVLTSYQAQSSLYLVPFAAIQKEIVAYTPPPTRVILYRRFMMRLAEALAEREGIRALITGDSLGQVASQTVENLDAVSRAISMPVFRPLIGDDKDTIVQIARQIGTYEISILPDADCCSLFVPEHPETRAALSAIGTIESHLEIPRLIETTLSETRLEKISPKSSHGS
ncbi:MAG: tRNA uracil 4-sulfurtransferase ThiI [Acidobacteriota bacterium]